LDKKGDKLRSEYIFMNLITGKIMQHVVCNIIEVKWLFLVLE